MWLWEWEAMATLKKFSAARWRKWLNLEIVSWPFTSLEIPAEFVRRRRCCRAIWTSIKASALGSSFTFTFFDQSNYLDWTVADLMASVSQVAFTGEIVIGNSYKKVLVREATIRLASTVVVGVEKHSALRGWASVAKYCVKRLSQTTEIVAIHGGKIVFRRCSSLDAEGHCEEEEPCHSIETFECKDKSTERSEISGYNSDGKASDLKAQDERHTLVVRSSRRSLTSVSLPVEDLTRQIPGWPLLRTASLKPAQHARKMSVVQWAMSLPSRPLSEVSTLSSSSNGSDHDSWGSTSNRSVSSSHQEVSKELKLILMKNALYCEVFSYNALKKATSDFSTGNLIGKGGCNSVYKGVVADGKRIAVKVMLSSKAAHKDFVREVEIMTSVKHKRIIPFIGICIDNDELISVYELSSRGNLEQNLQGNKKGKPSLPWEARFKIAYGIAEALDYLHSMCPKPVIHRDIKSSNILLTEELEPQLSDFGLAMWGPQSSSFLMDEDVVGTFGYLAPEYFMYGKVSEKIDVYSYGVVLLELLSGRKPISCEPARSKESLVMWARPKLETGDVRSIMDPNLDVKVNEDQVLKLALAAKLCLAQAARLRPRMNQILHILDGNKTRLEVKNDDSSRTCEDDNDDEVYPDSSAESHLSVAFQDVSEDSRSSLSSPVSVEAYLKKRWSRSSSLE